MFLVLLLYAIAAASFTIAKAILSFSKPIFFVGFRMTIAGAILIVYERIYYKRFPVINWKIDGIWFALAAIVQIYLTYVFDLIALQHMSSFKGALIYTASPFISALFSYFFFHEKLTLIKLFGLLVGLIGFLPTLIVQNDSIEGLREILLIAWPELMMFASVIAAVLGWIIMRFLLNIGYSTVTINGIAKAGGGVLALITSLLFEGWRTSPVNDWIPFLYLTTLIILIVNIFFYNLYGYLLQRYTVTFLSFAGFLSPLFAALFGWLWLGEVIHWSFFLSLILIATGLTIFYFEELRQGYISR